MRAAVILFCTGMLAGCTALGLGPGDSASLGRDDSFTAKAADGLLVYGVTVRHPGGGPVEGEVVWMAEKADLSFPEKLAIPLPDGLRAGERAAVVWRVPAGTWSVRQARWQAPGAGGATSVMSSRSLATTVAPGEAVYAGELVIDAGTRPAVIELGDDLGAARADLAAYPGVSVPPTNRPLADLRVAPPGGHHHAPQFF